MYIHQNFPHALAALKKKPISHSFLDRRSPQEDDDLSIEGSRYRKPTRDSNRSRHKTRSQQQQKQEREKEGETSGYGSDSYEGPPPMLTNGNDRQQVSSKRTQESVALPANSKKKFFFHQFQVFIKN